MENKTQRVKTGTNGLTIDLVNDSVTDNQGTQTIDFSGIRIEFVNQQTANDFIRYLI